MVLEGGYDLGALASSMAAVMPVLVDEVDARRRTSVELHPLARRALERLERYWPGAYCLICATYASE